MDNDNSPQPKIAPYGNSKPTWKRFLLPAVGVVLLVVGIYLVSRVFTKQDTSTPSAEDVVVNIIESDFIPPRLLVSKGTKVTWTNKGTKPHRIASNPHPEHTGLAGLDSKEPIGPGASYSYTFNEAGTFDYHDHFKPTLNGTVEVTDD
jgi:plastocyanin